jgi:hypothetical protein
MHHLGLMFTSGGVETSHNSTLQQAVSKWTGHNDHTRPPVDRIS